MPSAAISPDEEQRLAALRSPAVLDTGAEPLFDALTRAAAVTARPMALISLIDAERQWFKSNLGLPGLSEIPRDHAFCAHAILGPELLAITDARRDPRFADNPWVTGARSAVRTLLRRRADHAWGRDAHGHGVRDRS